MTDPLKRARALDAEIGDVCPDLSFIEFCKREREFYP